MNFESELKKGIFIITECNYCKKTVWPSSKICDFCLRQTKWRKSIGEGKIVEFSKKDDIYFCVVEIENAIKIIGQIDFGLPVIGDSVKITECKMVDGNTHVKFKIVN